MTANPWLIAAGAMSAAASLLHLAAIAGGGPWYRFLGAGERMARAAESGAWRPTLITLAIAAILLIWALYAFSGAGLIRRLPLLRTGLVVITVVYLARALAVGPMMAWRPDLSPGFIWWSSAIVLVIGLAYAIGTWTAWTALSGRAPVG